MNDNCNHETWQHIGESFTWWCYTCGILRKKTYKGEAEFIYEYPRQYGK